MSTQSRGCALRRLSSHDFDSEAKLHNEHPQIQSYQHKSYGPTDHSEDFRGEVVFAYEVRVRGKDYQRDNGKRKLNAEYGLRPK
mmetsp:Transcript_18439/g.26797  ORF Transcript_18439/g.26797 Transcript_18439/m.26797 type:complete len:84 (-) Transcript_18439:1249-1500(-)